MAIENYQDFSKRIYLSGKNEGYIKKFFTDELVLFFESNKCYHIETIKNGLLIQEMIDWQKCKRNENTN